MIHEKLKFHRLDISPYQGEIFRDLEKDLFSSLGVSFCEDPQDAEILITNTHTQLKNYNSDTFNKTEIIIHPNSGYDNFEPQFVQDAKFPIVLGNSVRAHGVSEFILSSLFYHFCAPPVSSQWQAERTWQRKRIADQNILIIGYGLIGTILEKSLSPLAQSVHVYDPFKNKPDLKLEDIDIVLVAAGLNPTSSKLINKTFLNSLNENWVLINAARGGIVHQDDLLEALSKNSKATAYLDVFESEPFEKDQFIKTPNLITSSHIAGVSKNLNQLILSFEKEIIQYFLTHRSNLTPFKEKYSHLLLENKLSSDKSFLI